MPAGVESGLRWVTVENLLKETSIMSSLGTFSWKQTWLWGAAIALVGVPAAVGCTSSSGAGGTGASTSVSTGLSSDETDTVSRGGDGSISIDEALALADSVFQFDPTIDPAASPAQNAQSIGTRTKTTGGACAMVTTSGTTVTADFGAAPGCKLTSGVTVTGTVSATVSASSGTTTVVLGLMNVTVNGRAIAGTLSFATTNGTTFQTTVALSTGSMLTGMITIVGSAAGFSLNGTLSSAASDATTSITLTNVAYVTGDCYPSAGSMAVTKGIVSETITFNQATATTGKVTVTIGSRPNTATLPAYGSCPPSGG